MKGFGGKTDIPYLQQPFICAAFQQLQATTLVFWSTILLKCDYRFSCCMTKGWMRNILHSRYKFYQECQSANSILLYFWCCQLPQLYQKSSLVMHDSVNIRAQYHLNHGLPQKSCPVLIWLLSPLLPDFRGYSRTRSLLLLYNFFMISFSAKPHINTVHQMRASILFFNYSEQKPQLVTMH